MNEVLFGVKVHDIVKHVADFIKETIPYNFNDYKISSSRHPLQI